MLVAVLTLALGVGASSWLFSMLRQWVIEAVSFPNPDRLECSGNWTRRRAGNGPVSAPDFLDWRAQNHVFENLSAWTRKEFNLTVALSRNELRARASLPTFPDLCVPRLSCPRHLTCACRLRLSQPVPTIGAFVYRC